MGYCPVTRQGCCPVVLYLGLEAGCGRIAGTEVCSVDGPPGGKDRSRIRRAPARVRAHYHVDNVGVGHVVLGDVVGSRSAGRRWPLWALDPVGIVGYGSSPLL